MVVTSKRVTSHSKYQDICPFHCFIGAPALQLDSICVSAFFAIKTKYVKRKLPFSKPASSEIV